MQDHGRNRVLKYRVTPRTLARHALCAVLGSVFLRHHGHPAVPELVSSSAGAGQEASCCWIAARSIQAPSRLIRPSRKSKMCKKRARTGPLTLQAEGVAPF